MNLSASSGADINVFVKLSSNHKAEERKHFQHFISNTK